VYLTSGNVAKAAETLERLVDIDAYDYRNQERLELLRGRVDEAHLKRDRQPAAEIEHTHAGS